MYRFGLALGGGGTRGFVHLGVYKALLEKGIQPGIISGTSAGSIAGSFLAAGLSPDEVHARFRDKGIYKMTRIHFPIDGLMVIDGLRKMLADLKYKRIEELPIPFVVTLANLNTGLVEYRNSGPLAEIVTASSSIPMLFSPVEIDGQQYVDGGVFDNVPVEPIQDLCQKTIAVNIMPVPEKEHVHNMIQVAKRVFNLAVHGASIHRAMDCDLLIEPKGLEKYDVLTNKKADELFEIGYQYTLNLPQLKLLLDSSV